MFWLIDLKPGESAPKGKNRLPNHRQYGLTVVQIDPDSGRVVRYMHETGGWEDLDGGEPVYPMVYNSLSGATRAVKIANPPAGSAGESRFAVWISKDCTEPASRAQIFCRHLECRLAERKA